MLQAVFRKVSLLALVETSTRLLLTLHKQFNDRQRSRKLKHTTEKASEYITTFLRDTTWKREHCQTIFPKETY